MKIIQFVAISIGCVVPAIAAGPPTKPFNRSSPHFEQTPTGFVGETKSYSVELASDTTAFVPKPGGAKWHLHFAGAAKVRGKGADPTGAVSNYFLGDNPQLWRTEVPHFRAVRFPEIWPGVDLVYRTEGGNVEYDFVVKPGADTSRIEVALDQGMKWKQAPSGDLLVDTTTGTFVMRKPKVYQQQGDVKVEVAAHYRLKGARVQFELAAYNQKRVLVIDPEISFSAYLGGSGDDIAAWAEGDSAGGVVLCGDTTSPNFPLSAGVLNGKFSPNSDSFESRDIFVTKFNASGQMVFCTYLGGAKYESCKGVHLDQTGNVYVAGRTNSEDFPTTSGAYSRTITNLRSFVTKLTPTGNALVYSTFFYSGDAFAIDGTGNAYLVYNTGNVGTTLTATNGAARPVRQGSAHLLKLNPSGSAIVYATGIGPGAYVFGLVQVGGGAAVVVDGAGNAYVAGVTTDASFQTTPGSYRTKYNDDVDAWLVKVNPTGTAIPFSTFIDTRNPYALAFGADGSIVVASSSSVLPPGAKTFGFPSGSSSRHVVILKLNTTGSQQIFASVIGGNDYDLPNDLKIADDGSIILAGTTWSSNFPVTPDAIDTIPGTSSTPDAFVARMSADGSALLYASYLGGTLEDRANALVLSGPDAWVVGTTKGDFPATTSQFAPGGGGTEAFVTKISGLAAPPGAYISSRGVVNGASFIPEITSGAWITIAGGNLASTSRSWRQSDFSGTRLPTSLEGTSVKINGKDAAIAYISPTQINALVPAMDFVGDAPLVITSPKGAAQRTVNIRQYSLGFFAFDFQSRKYVAAVHPDGAIVGKTGLAPGSRPVLARGRISLFGTGWGATGPSQPENQVFSGAYPIYGLEFLKVSIGGQPAQLEFAGAVSPGSYQINIVVPNLAPGDHAVTCEFGAYRTQPDLFITIQ